MLSTLTPLCLGAEAAKSRSDMAEELSRQLEDILSTYCRESLSDDNSPLDSGQSHSPELNGLTKGNGKPEDEKVNGGNNGTEKQQRKTQEKKKVKGLGKKYFPLCVRKTGQKVSYLTLNTICVRETVCLYFYELAVHTVNMLLLIDRTGSQTCCRMLQSQG